MKLKDFIKVKTSFLTEEKTFHKEMPKNSKKGTLGHEKVIVPTENIRKPKQVYFVTRNTFEKSHHLHREHLLAI